MDCCSHLNDRVSLIVNGKHIIIDKQILMKHSSVFKAMFESGMKNELVIPDFSTEVVKLFLFLFVIEYEVYGDVFGMVNLDLMLDLMAFSKKYDVTFLSNDLESILIERINLENFWKLFKFADMYSCEILEIGLLDFMFETNAYKLLNQPKYRRILGEHLTCKLYQLITNKFRVTVSERVDDMLNNLNYKLIE